MMLCESESEFTDFRNNLYSTVDRQGFLMNFYANVRRKDGSVFASKRDVIPLEDERGERECWVCIVSDVANR
jgi:hypothetical protein